MIAYRPACEGCSACVSVRIVADEFAPSRNQKRIVQAQRRSGASRSCARKRRANSSRCCAPIWIRAIPAAACATWACSTMSPWSRRRRSTRISWNIASSALTAARRGLSACALTDVLRDGLSMVYSFFHPGEDARSLGTYMILDHVEAARARGLPYVYLGYWVRGSDKMDYKSRFRPLEALGHDGWARLEI